MHLILNASVQTTVKDMKSMKMNESEAISFMPFLLFMVISAVPRI